jgi:hypothetical protein
MHRSFCRIHKKLRETPAIAAVLADRLQGISDILRGWTTGRPPWRAARE